MEAASTIVVGLKGLDCKLWSGSTRIWQAVVDDELVEEAFIHRKGSFPISNVLREVDSILQNKALLVTHRPIFPSKQAGGKDDCKP